AGFEEAWQAGENLAGAQAADDAAVSDRVSWLAAREVARKQEEGCQAVLLRCVLGNPFRPPPSLDPVLLTSDIVALAQNIYEERQLQQGTLDPGRLAALADALAAPRCTDAEPLAHLRGPGPHYRGCHEIDAIPCRQSTP